MVTSSKRAYATGSVIQDSCIQSPWPCNRPLLTYTSTGDIRTQVWLSLCWFSGSCCAQGFIQVFQASLAGMGSNSKCDFAPPTILLGPLLCLEPGVNFFGGIQHSSVDGCSAVSHNFAVLSGEDEHKFFYSAILWLKDLLSITHPSDQDPVPPPPHPTQIPHQEASTSLLTYPSEGRQN